MTNQASNPNNWVDANSNTPPSWWTGTAYIVDDSARHGVGTVMIMLVGPTAGDTFDINFQNFASPNPPGTSSSLILYNGDDIALQTWSLIGASGPTGTSYTFDGTEGQCYLQAITEESGSPFTTYQADFSLTPAVPVIAAQNASDTVAFSAPATALPYTVTSNGTPVTPDSLAIITPPTWGDVSIDGPVISYTPYPNYNGPDSLTYTGTVDGITSNVATISITIESPPVCDELGRVTRAYVSGYQRWRVHRSDLIRGEQRCLAAEFRGAISPARSIVSCQWMCQQNYAIFMSDARISGTECAVTINAQAASWCYMKCLATLDNGEVYTQLFLLMIRSAPWFVGEIFPTQSGPTILSAFQGS
jgi:hypothetical protein